MWPMCLLLSNTRVCDGQGGLACCNSWGCKESDTTEQLNWTDTNYWRKLSVEELMLLNCGVGEDSWESLGLQGDPTSQSWIFTGRTDAEAETPVLWPPLVKSWLIGKDPDAGRDRGQEEKGMIEDEMAGWHHWLDGHEFGWTLGVGDG